MPGLCSRSEFFKPKWSTDYQHLSLPIMLYSVRHSPFPLAVVMLWEAKQSFYQLQNFPFFLFLFNLLRYFIMTVLLEPSATDCQETWLHAFKTFMHPAVLLVISEPLKWRTSLAGNRIVFCSDCSLLVLWATLLSLSPSHWYFIDL